MCLITACFTHAYPRWTSRPYMHFPLIFQEVRPISKTRNQLYGYGLFEATMPSEKIRWIRSLQGAEWELYHPERSVVSL
jgi:hypothetical protein